jgi:hypothetical protein
MDTRWNPMTYATTTLCSIANLSYDKDMEELGMVDIAPELLANMRKGTDKRPYFNTEAMQQVAEHMQLKPTDGANFSAIDSSASALFKNTHTTNGQESIWSITSKTVEVNLSWARQEFHHLSKTLREISPEHTIFKESTFVDNKMETGSFGSNRSEELKQSYRETRASSFCLHACINKVEQLALFDRHQTGNPLPSGRAVPPKPKSLSARQDPGVG